MILHGCRRVVEFLCKARQFAWKSPNCLRMSLELRRIQYLEIHRKFCVTDKQMHNNLEKRDLLVMLSTCLCAITVRVLVLVTLFCCTLTYLPIPQFLLAIFSLKAMNDSLTLMPGSCSGTMYICMTSTPLLKPELVTGSAKRSSADRTLLFQALRR